MVQPADPKGRAWALLLGVHARLLERIEADLSHAGLPPLAWYDVLWELEKADGGALRMHELARRIVLSRSNLTRLADRMEKARLIERVDSPEDGRGYHIAATQAGRALRRKMWTVYGAAIERLFSRHVGAEEAATICAALGRVLKALP